jgi:hypothetical protein
MSEAGQLSELEQRVLRVEVMLAAVGLAELEPGA